jgi:iron complex transport system ATP-binding protein
MLRVENLLWQRHGFGLDVPSWTVDSGELHALAGCNGAGKSTLLKAIAGEIQAGRVYLHDIALDAWPALQRARHLAVLPQASELNFPFTAAEVVALGKTPLTLGWREAGQAVRRVMEETDTARLSDKDYRRLSGGERQRVHLARVLLQLSQADQPPLLLLDEPTSAQDLGQQHALLQLVRVLADRRDYGVVAVLHDINLCLRYAGRISLLQSGRLVDCGDPERVLTADAVRRYWGFPVEAYRNDSGARLLA